MADTEVENKAGFVDKRRNNKGQNTGRWITGAVANYDDVAGLRARLAVVNAGYYTAARLNGMTKNDMVMAVRQADDAAGI